MRRIYNEGFRIVKKRSRGTGRNFGFLFTVLLLFLTVSGAYAENLVCTDCHVFPHGETCTECTTCHRSLIGGTNHHSGVCTSCHDAGSPDGRAPHDGVAPSTTSSSCAVCHSLEATSQINHRTGTGTPGTCVDCHTEPGVQVLPNNVSITCGQCHGGGTNSTDNPPKPGVPWISEANLALWAAYMHNVKPDLIVSALSASGVIAPGSTIPITDTTKNQGVGAASASITKFYLSTDATLNGGDTELGTGRAVPALAAGASNSGTISVTVPSVAPGYYYIIAKADADGAVGESDETNNTKVKLVQISYPDLVVSALSTTGTPRSGQALTINDTTKNNGPGGVAASTTKFYLSANSTLDGGDTLLGSRAIPALASGATSSGSTAVTLPSVTGYWYLIANANDGCVVTEATCGNNTKWKLIYIAP